MLVNITLKGDRELALRLGDMPPTMRRVLRAKIESLSLDLEKHIKVDKLNGQVLNRIKGRLAGSIHAVVIDEGTLITGRVASSSDVPYAAVHEYGFDGEVTVGQHMRSVVFGKEVQPYSVGPYQRHMHMPERSFMRSALADMRPEITLGLKEAAVRGARESVGLA